MEERVLLQSNCSLYRVTTKEELDSFSCGDEDLDDFFHQEACFKKRPNRVMSHQRVGQIKRRNIKEKR